MTLVANSLRTKDSTGSSLLNGACASHAANDWNRIHCHRELLISLHCSGCSDAMQSDSFHFSLAHYQLLHQTARTHIFICTLDLTPVTMKTECGLGRGIRYKIMCAKHVLSKGIREKKSGGKSRIPQESQTGKLMFGWNPPLRGQEPFWERSSHGKVKADLRCRSENEYKTPWFSVMSTVDCPSRPWALSRISSQSIPVKYVLCVSFSSRNGYMNCAMVRGFLSYSVFILK